MRRGSTSRSISAAASRAFRGALASRWIISVRVTLVAPRSVDLSGWNATRGRRWTSNTVGGSALAGFAVPLELLDGLLLVEVVAGRALAVVLAHVLLRLRRAALLLRLFHDSGWYGRIAWGPSQAGEVLWLHPSLPSS